MISPGMFSFMAAFSFSLSRAELAAAINTLRFAKGVRGVPVCVCVWMDGVCIYVVCVCTFVHVRDT